MSSPAQRLRLPCPPYEGPDRCSACAGARVTGAVFSAAASSPRLLVDALCPVCDGCGRATHDGCRDDEHGQWDRDDHPDDDHLGGERDGCPFCGRRRWFPVLGWTEGGGQMHTLRVPCGCATDLLEEVPS